MKLTPNPTLSTLPLNWLALSLLACSRINPEPYDPRTPGVQTETEDTSTEDTNTSDTGNTVEPSTEPADETGEVIEPIVPTYPEHRVGIFYLAWHAYAANAIADVPASERLVVEDVIQDPNLHFSNILNDFGLFNAAAGFHYHSEPELGFYCLYRKRDTESTGVLNDCPNISHTAQTHAELLWNAGVDFVFVDLTNLSTMSEFSDGLGLRPFEVLVEEWYTLRQSGIPTPQIAAWVKATSESNALTTRLLDTYNNPIYDDLILTHQPTREKVMFIVGGTFQENSQEMNELTASQVLPVPMWGNLSQEELDNGMASWMQPCTYDDAFTTLISPSTDCNQFYTNTSPLGSVLSVSASYQIGYASLPLQASGKYGGLTFQKQFESAFSVRPDYLLINAWNEHIAQPQSNPYSSNLGGLRQSMGAAEPAGGTSENWLWVDLYGNALSRDIEPTIQGGSEAYNLMTSCLEIYGLGGSCSDSAWSNEACCQLSEGMTLVRSFANGGTSWEVDHLITADTNEITSLQSSGWTELCNPHYGPSELCAGANGAGPFLLYPNSDANRVALYRCNTGINHFFSTSASCEGTTVETILGYMSTERNSETPRPLRRCYNASAFVHFHWLGQKCPSDPAITEEAIIGYVK